MSIEAQLQCSYALRVPYAPEYAVRCTAALNEALDHTAAYATWRTYDPGRTFDVFARLAALPAVTKRELRAVGPQGFVPHARNMAAALATGEIELVSTSGTTSDQVTNIWYQPWWNASEAASWQINARACTVATGAHREAILTSPFCTGVPCEDGFLRREQRTLGRFLYLSERSDPSTWPESLMDRMVSEINAFRPVLLEANPSFLACLARHIVRRNLRVQVPAIIVLTYEHPSVLHYRHIRRAFDAPIASSYGATEVGYVFMECVYGHLHQVSSHCHVDFLPFAPEQGGPGIGRILVTPFGNPWRALLRFDIGDVVRLAPQACRCGRHDGLVLASVEGRTANLTLTTDGRAVTQGEVDRALGTVAGLTAYQWLQTSRATYRLRFVAEDTAARRVAGAAREVLRAIYGPTADIALDAVEALAPDPPGKYRLSRALEPVDADALLDERYAPRKV